ncbi:MAG: tRNA (adenosine(37)-N6)-dimethylallyltransferase MiaA [Clostridia bacterium]|nr:tRNA (adenosine(37)-N6)-dimethylallyltransferase MiaA [Clostridia bacterium]
MNKLLVICGATATGKTNLAVDCALKLNSEVISADSQLIYKGLNIGTAKPAQNEMRGVKHHMIDVVEPTYEYSVSEYANTAEPIVKRLLADGKTPIICGGTGFYINSILYDLSYGNIGENKKVRQHYAKLLEEKGKEYIYGLLQKADPQTAEKLHINDTKRVIRALEIYKVGGRKKSDICDGQKAKYNYLAVAIDFPREELYDRINRRVDVMFENGLVDEVKNLLNRGVTENNRCMQAIGYKEVLNCLNNGDNESTMRDIIKQNTRRYAKRQITFFKRLEGIVWLQPNEATAEKVLELLNG